MNARFFSVVAGCCLAFGCIGSDERGGADGGDPLASLGGGDHTLANLELLEVGVDGDGLRTPRDLKFHPDRKDELWVVNQTDSSIVVFQGIGTGASSSQKFRDTVAGPHFLAKPSGLAFNDDGTFATIHEEDEETQGEMTPADFMGPTLWTSDLEIFDAGDEGHLDMLHNSPNGMGIAWEGGNAYWVFDGYHEAIVRYDFHDDHGPAGTDHTDGEIARYVEGEVAYVEGVPSHLAFDPASRLLYIADTGNARIAVLDTTTGTEGSNVSPNYDGADQYRVNGATIETLIDADDGLERPSGLLLRDGLLFVTDNATSRVWAFSLEGEAIDWLDTGLPAGSLMGIEFDGNGRMYLADGPGDRIVRIAPK